MSATGNAAGNATCNASANARVSAAEKRAQQEEEEVEGAAPPPAVIVHPEHKDADLIPSQDLVRLIKHASPCAGVRGRAQAPGHQGPGRILQLHEDDKRGTILATARDHPPADDALSTSVTGLLHQTGRLRQDVRAPACHGPLQPVHQHRQQHHLQRVRHLREHRKGGCGSGRNHGARGFQALSEDHRPQQGRRPQRQRVEHLMRGLPQREMRDHSRGEHNVCGQPKHSRLESTPWLLRILLRVPLREDGEFFSL
ncbi:hypothetical protein HPB48_009965 [Haemaphysalis longicornis]|uniref:Uncharacterized protein n=1 Tax=Haemaphysalis longicornis TaxID=44386 RepID=A0A9J6FWE9_HAELO|nr:hypothetical protein HPB48_009965 [Haemaphysalis longicornis]